MISRTKIKETLQTNPKIKNMKTAAIIVTGIATLLFLYSSFMLTYDPVVRSTKDGMLLFNFMMWYTIPGILWTIYFLTKKK
jgi:hypothetical protein